MINLMLGDCLERMKELADNSIDVSITSPPYNMNLRIRGGRHCSRQVVKELSTKYENFPDNLPMDMYFEFNRRVVKELLRISGTVFYNVQFLTGNKSALYKLIGVYSKNIKEFIVWDKGNAEPAIGKGVLNSRWEAILVLTSEKDAISRSFSSANFGRGTLQNILQIKRGKKIMAGHGATFPEDLVTVLIENFTSVGDIIFDPFLGSGTTGVVAVRNQRKFIGVEIDPEYLRFARNRIQNASIESLI